MAQLPPDLRAAAIAGAQRGAGNHAIARALAGRTSSRLQREPADAPAATAPAAAGPAPAAGALVVEDSVEDLAPTQMKRSAFLAQLRSQVTAAVEAALAGSPLAAVARPQVSAELEGRFAIYSAKDAAGLERAVLADLARGPAPSAASLISMAAGATREAIAERLSSEEGGDPAAQAASAASEIGAAASGVVGAAGDLASKVLSILFKRRRGAGGAAAEATAVRARLGAGAPLPPAARAPMEAVLGEDFSDVRLHTAGEAARAADEHGARAFTVGRDVAFGSGEYQPGTPAGDALLAHELAHVAQQRGGGTEAGEAALEADANQAAMAAVAREYLETDMRKGPSLRRLRSGLQLQRCSKNEKKPIDGDALGKRVVSGMAAANSADPNKGVFYWDTYKAMAEAGTAGFEWKEDYRFGHTKAPKWRKTGDFAWEWVGTPSKPSDALDAWLAGPTIADCASVAVALHYKTILEQVGAENFDHYFSRKGHPLVISQYVKDVALTKFMKSVDRKTDLKIGDLYYFKNHRDYKYKHPRGLWTGENAIYMGEGKWQGFGSGILDEPGMLAKLVEMYDRHRTPDEVKDVEAKRQQDGTLPPQYEFTDKGGTLVNKLEKVQALTAGGGGLEDSGQRLDPNAVQALRDDEKGPQ